MIAHNNLYFTLHAPHMYIHYNGLKSSVRHIYVIHSSYHVRYVVGVVFGFEHLLLVLALWLRYAIHPVTKSVRLAITRRNYLAQQRSEELGGGDLAQVVDRKRKSD